MAFTVSDWKAAFKADLEGRVGLTGVTIYDSEESTADLAREHVVIGDFEVDYEFISLRVQSERYAVTGRVSVIKPGSAKAARDRVLALLDEVKSQIDSDREASASVWDSRFVRYSVEERIAPDNGRIAIAEFVIEVEAHE